MKEAGRKDGNRRLPDTELEVMQAVWALGGPALRAEIDEILRKKHPMAQTTLLTLLSRLAEKGFLKIEKNGPKRPVYSAGGKRGVSGGAKPPVFGSAVRRKSPGLCFGP